MDKKKLGLLRAQLKKGKEEKEEEEKILNIFHTEYPQYWYIFKRKERLYRTTPCYGEQTYSRVDTSSTKGIFFSYDDALKYLPRNKEETDPFQEDDDSCNPKPTLLSTEWYYEIKCCKNDTEGKGNEVQTKEKIRKIRK